MPVNIALDVRLASPTGSRPSEAVGELRSATIGGGRGGVPLYDLGVDVLVVSLYSSATKSCRVIPWHDYKYQWMVCPTSSEQDNETKNN